MGTDAIENRRPVEDYPRFKWLVPGIIAGAPHPDLSRGIAGAAPLLRAQGIGAIVTLMDKPLEPNPEGLGFQYLFVETANYRPPANLQPILAFIDRQTQESRAVLVHCFAGIGRTGTVLAAWLLHQTSELSVEEAVARVRDQYVQGDAQSRFPEDPSQLEALVTFARRRTIPQLPF
jgi:atypical dual specificity phosphatase